MSGNNPSYKGKVTHRSWSELPEEIVRVIATDLIFLCSNTGYCPETWEARPFWYQRVVYTALREAVALEVLMNVCPKWTAALEVHNFWNHVIHVLDPQDTFIRHNPGSIRHSTPWSIYRFISHHACLVCRVNYPTLSKGIGIAERIVNVNTLGSVGVCREHKGRAAFCGLCLRESRPYEEDANCDPAYSVLCSSNEDDDLLSGIEATCRSCRSEWLWKYASRSPKEREAIGGRRFSSHDWETQTMVDCFVDLGEGTIQDVINLALERHWLRKFTRLGDMMSQAVAASRLNNAENEDDLEMELSSELDEEEEEDSEFLQLTEESGVKELAVGDWARHRILDGHWLSPADQWYGNKTWIVPAIHPCPWTIEEDGDPPLTHEEHPTRNIVREEMPPSFTLCEFAFQVHRKQLRSVLLPAMKNIVRKLVIECDADGIDPAIVAARMSMEDVMRELREDAIWFDGVDWLERRRNKRREEMRSRHPREENSDDHSSSGKSSDGSSVTSPVLSTSTLHTTPSPPPLTDKNDDSKQPEQYPRRQVTIAVAPVLNPPRLIHPIPYVPTSAAHLPQFSMESFKQVWREACSPLYHCRCSICIRAQMKAQADAAATAGPQYSPTVATENIPENTPARPIEPGIENKHHEIALHEVSKEEMDHEAHDEVDEELDYDDDEVRSDIADRDEDEEEAAISRHRLRVRSRSPSLPPVEPTPQELKIRDLERKRTSSNGSRQALPKSIPGRKRSCDELDDSYLRSSNGVDSHARSGGDRDLPSSYHRGEPGTPSKRPRRGDAPSLQELDEKFMGSPQAHRMRKRSSEELDDAIELKGAGGKRMKVSSDEREREEDSSGGSPPRSTSISAESDDISDDGGVGVGKTTMGVGNVPRSARDNPEGDDGIIGGGTGLGPALPPTAKRKIALPGRHWNRHQ